MRGHRLGKRSRNKTSHPHAKAPGPNEPQLDEAVRGDFPTPLPPVPTRLNLLGLEIGPRQTSAVRSLCWTSLGRRLFTAAPNTRAFKKQVGVRRQSEKRRGTASTTALLVPAAEYTCLSHHNVVSGVRLFSVEPLVTGCFPPSFLFLICSRRSRIHFVGQRWEEKTHETHVLGPADLRPGEDFRTNEILGGAREGSLGLFVGDDGESGQGEWTLQTSRESSPMYIMRARVRTHTHTQTPQTNKQPPEGAVREARGAMRSAKGVEGEVTKALGSLGRANC